MSIDIAELRRLAEAATPGPWAAEADSRIATVALVSNIRVGREFEYTYAANYLEHSSIEADAAYIAAANPAAILSLLDELEALRAALDDIWACANSGYTLDELKQKIALYTESAALPGAEGERKDG